MLLATFMKMSLAQLPWTWLISLTERNINISDNNFIQFHFLVDFCEKLVLLVNCLPFTVLKGTNSKNTTIIYITIITITTIMNTAQCSCLYEQFDLDFMVFNMCVMLVILHFPTKWR